MTKAAVKPTTTRKRKRRVAPKPKSERSLYERLKDHPLEPLRLSPEEIAELRKREAERQERRRVIDRAMAEEAWPHRFSSQSIRPPAVGQWTQKREIFEAIRGRRFPDKIPGTAAVKKQVDADWADECKARKVQNLPPPVWSSINHWLGRD